MKLEHIPILFLCQNQVLDLGVILQKMTSYFYYLALSLRGGAEPFKMPVGK